HDRSAENLLYADRYCGRFILRILPNECAQHRKTYSIRIFEVVPESCAERRLAVDPLNGALQVLAKCRVEVIAPGHQPVCGQIELVVSCGVRPAVCRKIRAKRNSKSPAFAPVLRLRSEIVLRGVIPLRVDHA